MDTYRFINSIDITKHLKDIGYQFSALEIAWLIWQCKTITMKERHAAWEELIQTTSDCKVGKDHCVIEWSSLHQLISRYVDLETKFFALLSSDNDETVCFYQLLKPDLYSNAKESVWLDESLCARYSDAFSIATDPDYNCGSYPFRIRKESFDGALDLTGEFNAQGELMRMHYQRQSFVTGITGNLLTNSEIEILCKSFERMWFDFPLPFKEGDIVQDVFQKEPFVLSDTDAWMRQSSPVYMNGRSNMLSFGFAYDRKEIILEHQTPYMDLTYCPKPLDGSKRILSVFSKFQKGEIDTWTLLRLFRMYECGEIATEDYRRLKSYGAVK